MAGRAGDTLEPVSSRPATEAANIATRRQKRARNLLSLATALSRSVTPDEVADAMFDEGLRALGADAASFALVAESDDGAIVFRTIRSSGYDNETDNQYRSDHAPSRATSVRRNPVASTGARRLARRLGHAISGTICRRRIDRPRSTRCAAGRRRRSRARRNGLRVPRPTSLR